MEGTENALPTISDVAQAAGVSIATVSRVMNKSAPVSERASSAVLSAVELTGYKPLRKVRSYSKAHNQFKQLRERMTPLEDFAKWVISLDSAPVEIKRMTTLQLISSRARTALREAGLDRDFS